MKKSTGERIGDDLYIYKGNHVIIVKNFYDKKNKKKKDKNKKPLKSYQKTILWAIFLIGIIFTAYIINTPISKSPSNEIQFSFEADKNAIRVGYSIDFSWEISNTPSQAVIIWGDGATFDIKDKLNHNNGMLFGITNHTYALQGRYNPTLTIWDVYGHQYSKSLELTIQNDMFLFNISCQDQVFEDQEISINVEGVFELNKELRKDIENLTYIYDFGDDQLTSNNANLSYNWKNEGNYTLTISIIDSQGTISRRSKSIQVKNKPPEAAFTILSKGYHYEFSEIKFSAEKSIDTESDENSLRYLWNWGDNTASWGKFSTHTYSSIGGYTVTLHVIDDNWITNSFSEDVVILPVGGIVNWNDPPNNEIVDPYVAIGTLPDIVYEDDQVQLISEIGLQEGNLTGYTFAWDFGDETYSYEKAPKHAWSKTGVYTIILYVWDKYGTKYIREEEISVEEKAPEILGPISFQGIEGKAIILDVEVYDAILDQPYLKFEWYDQNDELYSTNKKPTIVLNNGNYRYTLNITDPSGLTSSCEIDITVLPFAPEIYVPNYMYYGPPGDLLSTDDIGRLTLRVYSYDCDFDLSELQHKWYISNGKKKNYKWDIYDGNFSQITVKCTKTTIYHGEVEVSDPSGNTRIASFEIYSYVDIPVDESTEQLEEVLDLKLSGPEDSTDSDNDNLSDLYEIEVTGTNPFNHDTDNDGLYDGFDNNGIGEQTLGTSPIDADSDFDKLEDGQEYWGWDISIDYFENTSSIHVTSNPCRSDTDYDRLTDYEEFLAGTHPRLEDSDSDKLKDYWDPFPTTWDFDVDGLSDYMEQTIGSNMSNSDTDGDGLKDGEEVFNLLTDPTRSDSDFDFASDSQEIMNYKIRLEDEYGKGVRVNLTEPVSLHFPKFFTKAAIAQIAFTITFGEYGNDDSQEYGVKDDDVSQLNVVITKSSDNLILYNSTTNTTRYFSHVVDITDIMNNESLAFNYYGEYIIKVRDLNGARVSGCLLEKFELDFSRPLDPNCEDFDGDGILDGVEMGLLVRGIERIDIKDFYNCTSNGQQYDYESGEANEFSLEIPDIGRVYGAILTLEIMSSEILEGKGNVSIEIIYKNLKTTIADSVILSIFEEFNTGDNYLYKSTLDLSNFIINEKISEYYGEYVLTIEIQDTNSNDTFYISEYYIETDTYVQAGPQDSHAWITDASLYDSDEDGWSDYYEIFTSETNPLCKDSDGDNAWDSNDRDPLRNVMIEIRPISGTFVNQYFPWPTPTLEIVFKFHINDLIDPDFSEESSNIGICTAPKLATTNPNSWGAYQIAWWNSGEGHHYYIDISDDITVQSNSIPLYSQLWQMLSTGDVDILGTWFWDRYSINNVGHWEDTTIFYNGDGIRYQIETIAIERVNTIAIFDPNGTTFSGHYQEQERMNMIQLHITADGYYPASISFEHEEEGTMSNEWEDGEIWYDQSYPGQNPIVIDELDGHNKVLQFHDMSLRKGRIVHDWNRNVHSGTIELWVRISALSRADVIIRDGSDLNSIYFRFDTSGYFQYKYGSTFYNIDQYTINEWIHLKFRWDFWEDWHLWINGKSYDRIVDIITHETIGFEYLGTPYEMDSLVLQTNDAAVNYYFSVDSIGYSFDPFYTIGDNLIRSDTNGTPFKPGPNIIVVPTSLFSNTLLNSYFQNEELEKTPLYTEQDGLYEFYSIDRDGNIVGDQCGDTDFIFVRYDILPQDAMKILNSLLTCVINESKDENNNTITTFSKVFDYVSTKFNGTKAVSMNLPQGLLLFIPWISDFTNSPFGIPPKTLDFLGFLLVGLLIIIFPFVGIVVTIFITVVLFSAMFGKIAAQIGLAILTFLAILSWILIRAALIIFFFIVLAIEVITTVPIFLAMGAGLAVFSWFLDMNVNFGVNCIPLYAQDTRIGHVGVDITGSEFILEAWIKWIYWEFFDLFIPYVDMNFEMDPDSPLIQPPEDPSNGIGTFLTCGYDQISEYVFNFHTIYWDTPYNTPPEYVILTLLSPSGNAYNYSMDVSPVGYKSIDYWTGKEDSRTGEPYTYNHVEHTFIPPNWYRGVMFNVTIDFKSEFTVYERNGQWYYQFRTKAEREDAIEVVWPCDEYALGPYFNETGNISEIPDFEGLLYSELSPYSGHTNQEFNFSVWWADYEYNTLPTEVDLVLELPNGTILNYQMSAFSSVQYDYSMVSDYGWVTFTEYKCILNFSEYMITETALLKHHYRAVHPNGNIETLFDTILVDELGLVIGSEDELDYLNATEVDTWFEGPLVFPYSDGKPLIKKWDVQDLTNNKYLRNFDYGDMIWEEQELVFWVYVYDPDRSPDYYRRPICYADGYPMLTLTNYGDPAKNITLSEFIWSRYDYDLQADIFWVQIGADEIGAGLWNFEFAINDTQGNSYVVLKENLPRIWIVGSVDQIFNTLIGSITDFGYAPTVFFLMFAGIAQSGSFNYGIVAACLTLATVITTSALILSKINYLLGSTNTGGLYGLGWALITIALCLNSGLQFTEGKTFQIGYIFDNLLFMTGFLTFSEFSLVGDLLFYLSSAIGFMSLSMVLGITVNGISSATSGGGKSFEASTWIKNIITCYCLFIALIGLFCFVFAGVQNGACYGMEI